MDKFKRLCELCSASVHITYNQHKAYYETVEQYLSENDDITEDELVEMKRLDTIYEVQFYPHTPDASIRVISHDLDKAITEALEMAEWWQ